MLKTLPILAFLCLAMAPMAAWAASSPWATAAHLQARLIAAGNTGAIEIKPEAGWHFYWRQPGDAGQAPRIGWQGSTNLDSGTLQWPVPTRFTVGNLIGFGYTADTILPLMLKAKSPGQPLSLQGTLSILVCRDVCVPQSLAMNIAVPQTPDADSGMLAKAIAALPATVDKPSLKIESTIVGPDALVIRAYSEHGFTGADLFAEPATLHAFNAPQIMPDANDARHASLRIAKTSPAQNLARDVMGKTLILTLVTKDGAVEKTIAF